MKKSLLLFLALLLCGVLRAQENIYIIHESFDDASLPEGWSTMGNGMNNWYISPSNIAGGKPNEVQLSWTPMFNGISRLVSPAVDLTDVSSAVLELKHYLAVFSGTSTIGVATSSDNGSTWNSVWSGQFNATNQYSVLETIEGPDMGKDNVIFCIYFEGNSSAISSWYFDDFHVYTVEDLSIEFSSIDVPSIVSHGKHNISFTIKNTGNTEIQSLKARYEIDGEQEEQTFYANIASMESKQFTFNDKFIFEPNEDYTLEIELLEINNSDIETDNVMSKGIISALSHTEMTPMIEHFSSSTCGPCVFINNTMHELTANHEGEYTYTKYTTNGPGLGDPYYTEEVGTRTDYYNVIGVPQLYLNGVDCGSTSAITEDDFVLCRNSQAFANVRGAYSIEGNTINITADFMSYFDIEDVRAFVTVNEKTTTGNASSNGETEFHHIMMKMLENAEGNNMDINAGEYQRLQFSVDMSSTNVEEMDDLEVALWLQNYETKEVFNSHFAYENTAHCYPVQNLSAETINNGTALNIGWNAPEAGTPTGYNVYIDGKLVAENISGLNYYTEDIDTDEKVAEVVALYENGKSSVGLAKVITIGNYIDEADDTDLNIYPNPAKDFVRITGADINTISIYNCLGVLIDEIEVKNDEIEINTSDYSRGIYIIKAEGDSQILNHKIVVK